jgi:phosphoribosylamine--glycine ligase
MKVLVLGGGGREHAIAWRLSRDADVSAIYCAPGNAGTVQVARNVAIDPANPADVLRFVEERSIDLTVVGPELPLTRGVADLLSSRGRLVFGPTRAAAEIESSKVFAKEFMRRHAIPTAAFDVCTTADEARAAIASGRFAFPVVVKADGLAAGKGVIIAHDAAEARAAIDAVMVDRQFGEAGERAVIEEHLEGPEVSVFAISDGTRAMPFQTAQDHKRAFDGDRGPNTGGMGAFAPSPLVDEALGATIADQVIAPTIEGLRREGRVFRGFLYAGLMLTADGPKVLEFNARLGDPETQVLLPLLDEDLLPLLEQASAGRLSRTRCRFSSATEVGVVLASAGYPDKYATGKEISGLDRAAALAGVLVFHAGTTWRDDHVVTAGGRVLAVVGGGSDYAEAMLRAYDAVAQVSFDGMYCRKDIGTKAVTHEGPRV